MTKYKVWFLYEGRAMWRTTEGLFDTHAEAQKEATVMMVRGGYDGVYTLRGLSDRNHSKVAGQR